MKKLILLIITLFCVVCLHAQNNSNNIPLSNEDFFNQAEIVFEGFFIKTVATYNPRGNNNFDDTYVVSAYKAQKVYKGNHIFAGDTLYIVFKGGLLGSEKTYPGSKINTSGDLPVIITEEIQYFIPDILWNNNCGGCINASTISIFF